MPDRARLRLDKALVDRGLSSSRARARALIEAGHVSCDGRIADKSSLLVRADTDIAVTGEVNPWVSRGGLKLAAALEHFRIDPNGAECLDIGASTGGFTDVLLAGGAARVHAVDVGRGQLVDRIARDPRVVVLERTDARDIATRLAGVEIDLVVCDVSFISIRKAIMPSLELAREGARFVGLVKPQFEVGPGKVGSGGVVRDPTLLEQVRDETREWFGSLTDWRCDGVIESPITGGDGNREFLMVGSKLC